MRLMDDVLRPFTKSFVVVYLDDIVIFNRTCEENMRHIQQVLNTLLQHKLYANLEKFSFVMNVVQELGYTVDEHGEHVDLAKIQFIRDGPTLTTLTDLRRFLRLANFYRRFVLGFSHIAWALIQGTKGGCRANFMWGKEKKREFNDLKDCLCSSPILSLHNLQQPFEIETDASNYDVGAVLTQQGHLVEYHSETLSDTVKKYSTHENEIYSIVKSYRQ
jgi:hypothetical protein